MRSLVRVSLALSVLLLMSPLAWAGDGLALTRPWAGIAEQIRLQRQRETHPGSGRRARGKRHEGRRLPVRVIDDCWQVRRDAAGKIVADPERFPSGIKALADAIHAKGLKFGIYSDAGTMTCAKRPGSKNHEVQDAKTYAEWGVDYLKYDWCSTDGQDTRDSYAKMSHALRASGRPIVFSICEWAQQAVDLGRGHRAPVARTRRHPGLLGLRRQLGWHGRGSHHRLMPTFTHFPALATGTTRTCSRSAIAGSP